MIREAYEDESFLLEIAVASHNYPYLNKIYVREDIENNELYVLEIDGVLTCMATLTYDEEFSMHYIKRFLILSESDKGKGYAKTLIEQLSLMEDKVAITPHRDNTPMKSLVEKVGFTYQYDLENGLTYYEKNNVSEVSAWN